MKPRGVEEPVEKAKITKQAESDVTPCRSLRLLDNLPVTKV